MSKIQLVDVCNGEISRVDRTNHSFTLTLMGKSTAGTARTVQVELEPWIVQYLLRELAGVPKQLRKVVAEMESAFQSELEKQ